MKTVEFTMSDTLFERLEAEATNLDTTVGVYCRLLIQKNIASRDMMGESDLAGLHSELEWELEWSTS